MPLVRSLLAAIFPHRWLSRGHELILGLQENPEFFEKCDRKVFFQRAFTLVKKNSIPGDYAEFGSHGGMTFVHAYNQSQKYAKADCPRLLWSFDSFQGLPQQEGPKDDHPAWVAGHLKMGVKDFERILSWHGVPPTAYRVVPGFYADTIGQEGDAPMPEFPGDIAIAYIDCDLYSSTKTVLDFLAKRLKHGMILGFDDYYLYSATAASGERVALLELARDVRERYQFVPYVQFGYAGMSFVVEDKRLTESQPDLLLTH
jgi:hypothetical protein